MQEKIHKLLSELSLDLEYAKPIQTYIEFLLKANKRISLTQSDDFDLWFVNHIEDGLRAYKLFESYKLPFIDCGSGNGLPGVLFSILSGQMTTLCDVDSRKCEFLKAALYKVRQKGQVVCGSLLDLKVEQTSVFIYRGLGPESLLRKAEKKFYRHKHFRFISGSQSLLFQNSKRKRYALSDGSQRFLELT